MSDRIDIPDATHTVVRRDGAVLTFTVICPDADYAERAMTTLHEIIADEGSEKVRVTFQNMRLEP
jgi:hypothetical protein